MGKKKRLNYRAIISSLIIVIIGLLIFIIYKNWGVLILAISGGLLTNKEFIEWIIRLFSSENGKEQSMIESPNSTQEQVNIKSKGHTFYKANVIIQPKRNIKVVKKK